jgi:CRISPR-associated protein Csm2
MDDLKLLETIETMEAGKIVELAEKYAKIFRDDKLKTTQLRNVYSAITRMRIDFDQENDENKKFGAVENHLVFLKPKIAYAAGRQKAVRDHFYDFMKYSINGVLQSNKKVVATRKFFSLVESVVAYHKFYEA